VRKVAIIKGRELCFGYNDYDDTYSKVANSITDWTEVTDEEYDLLVKAQRYDCHDFFTIIERPIDEPKFIANSVADYVKWAKKEQDKRDAEEAARRELALQRKLKREAKTKADRQKMYEKLQQEFGE
jgi:hypothetical protein